MKRKRRNHSASFKSKVALARLAGGAFGVITGVDLEAEKLADNPPEGFQSGPTDEAEEENVAVDPDEDLP